MRAARMSGMSRSPEPTPLLLHSLGEFRDLVLACLEVVRPRTVVEVGGEGGTFTAALGEWAQGAGARVRCVEPAPSDAVRELPARFPGLELVEARSPEALRSFEPCDVYVLDGDHNHWTVLNELRTIAEHARSEPLVILHDVGWPCARRDFYYAPEALPAEAVRPHSFSDGAVPGRSELIHRGGYRGAGQMALATEEGGPGNGV